MDNPDHTEGLRERKRRQTLQRIAEVGLRLFLAKGYEATTLEEIAAAADIARRTFFYYFKSKDDILLAYQAGFADALKAAILAESTDVSPLEAVRNALIRLATGFQSPQAIAIDRLMRANEALRARKQANYLQQEQAVFDALCELWPGKKRQPALRLVAMASIGAMRIAVEEWSQHDGKRPLAKFVREAFANLKAEI